MVPGLPAVPTWVLAKVPPPASDSLGAVGVGLGTGSVLWGAFDSLGFFTPTPPPEGCGGKGVDAVGGAKLSGPDLERPEAVKLLC